MTGWTERDYEHAGGQDADQVTASPLTLQAEYQHGAATAWQTTEHSAAGGHSADHIEQQHLELNGPTADRGQRTVAESAWHRGYDAGAGGSVSLLRDLEKEAGLPARPPQSPRLEPSDAGIPFPGPIQAGALSESLRRMGLK